LRGEVAGRQADQLGVGGGPAALVHDQPPFADLDLDQRADNFRIEAFFFVPMNLGVNRISYPKDGFYGDLQSYTRYKTPVMTFGPMATWMTAPGVLA
jgi:hypothetical protein